MDASLMVEEVVEDDMERVPEDPCLGQFMGRKILQLGYWEKNSFFYPMLSSSPYWIKKGSLKTPLRRVCFEEGKGNTVETRMQTDQKG